MTEAAFCCQTLFLEQTARPEHFHEMEAAAYEELFDQHVLGADSALAHTLGMDGANVMLAKDIVCLMEKAMGRSLSSREVHTVQTCFDTDTSAILSRSCFLHNLARLQQLSREPQRPTHYSSYDKLNTDKTRHKRLPYEPQRAFNWPITTGQCTGWDCCKELNNFDKHYPLNTTDVVRREGRSLADYYSL